MALSPWNASKATIRILARQNKAHASFRVDAIQTVEQREAVERAVRESGVDFPPFITRNRSIGLLQGYDEVYGCFSVNRIQRVENDENLNRGQRVEQMRIVRYIPAKTSGGVPTAQDKLNHFVAIHFLGATHDFHR